jgi:hypothetical protein
MLCLGEKEVLMMAVKVQKWNKFNWQQERNLIISNHHLYNFNKKSKSLFLISRVEASHHDHLPGWSHQEPFPWLH